MTASIKKSATGVTKKKQSVTSKAATKSSAKVDVKATVSKNVDDVNNNAGSKSGQTVQPAKTKPASENKTEPRAAAISAKDPVTEPTAGSVDVKNLSANKTVKKAKGKTAVKAKSKSKSRESKLAENKSKAEIKAEEKAAMKDREIEKKAKKASEKAKEMARNKSKKREKQHSKIKYERRMKREEAVTYFTSLIAGLEKGTVQFKQGSDTVVLSPCDLVDVEIKAETKGRDEKVTFEISWLTDSAQDISISSG